MKKEIIIFTFILIVFCYKMVSQDHTFENLVPNHSFEESEYGFAPKHWMTKNNCSNGFLYFYNNQNYIYGEENTNFGINYAGIWDCGYQFDGIGIKLNEELHSYVRYELKFHISAMDANRTSNGECHGKIILSDRENNRKPNNKVWDDVCRTSENDKYVELTKSIKISSSNADYLFFTDKNDLFHSSNGYFIDNISLRECGYDKPCSRLNEKINPNFYGEINDNNIASISNIENVEKAVNMRIVDVAGKTIVSFDDIESPNGLKTIKWDGKDGYGSYVPDGAYFWEVTLKNNCYTYEGNFHIAKVANPDFEINNLTTGDYSTISTPKPCCDYQDNVNLTNGQLTGQFPVIAKQTIKATDVTISEEGDKVFFQAGSNIELNNGFKVEDGAEFEAVIETCD